MTCKQLGGACDIEFQANSFEEISEMSKQHGIDMFEQADKEHLEAMDKMRDLMHNPGAMKEWIENKKKEFEELTEN